MALAGSDYWREQVTGHWDLLDRLARKRFPGANTAHEALLYVLEQLEEDDWGRVRAYEGKARFKTYLSLIALRLLEDFARNRFGRARPPSWIKAQGPLWEEVYRLLCLERMSVEDVVNSMTGAASGYRSASIVEEAIGVILSRVIDCGKKSGEAVSLEPDDMDARTPVHPSLHHLTPEDFLEARERASVLETMAHCLNSANSKPNPGAPGGESIGDISWRLRSQLDLNTEERLFLKAVYQDGLSVSSAGRLLGWNANQAHGKLRRLLARLRKGFRDAGLEQELKSILESGREFEEMT